MRNDRFVVFFTVFFLACSPIFFFGYFVMLVFRGSAMTFRPMLLLNTV